MWKSISTKILIGFLSVVLFTFLVTALAFYPILIGVLEKRAEIGLERQAWEIAHTINLGAIPSEENKTPLTILLLGRSVESDFLWINAQDRILYSSRPEQFRVNQIVSQLPESLRQEQSYNRDQANIFNNNIYLAAEVPDRSGGTVLTFVALSKLQSMYRETLLTIFGSLAAAFVMALLIAFFLIRYLVRPLGLLEDYAKAVGNRQFKFRLEVKSNDELAQLATAVNEMADRLQRYDESRSRFFQNASHELKTPLMSIHGYAEGIRDGVFTGPALNQAVEIIHKESLRLRDVVENMIDITILDQPHDSYFLPHDLSYIMEQALETVGGYALERNVQIKANASRSIWVVGDWDQLHSLFVNVLSNGIRHANNHIEVITASEGNQAIIKIKDDGTGFTPTALAHAFDYFYTGDKAGSGLGLTIAQKIVEEHSGTIKIHNLASGGAEVIIALPSSLESET